MNQFLAHNRRLLSHGQFKDEIVSGDFRNGVAVQSQFEAVHFKGAQMDCFNFTNSLFLDCSFTECSLTMSSFNASAMKNVVFTDCNLDQSRFQLSHLENVSFLGGRMEYATFEDASVEGLTFETQLHGTELTFARAKGLSFGESNLWGVTMRLSCGFFKGTKVGRRSVALFLNLLASTEGNHGLAELTTDKEQRLARRLIAGRSEP